MRAVVVIMLVLCFSSCREGFQKQADPTPSIGQEQEKRQSLPPDTVVWTAEDTVWTDEELYGDKDSMWYEIERHKWLDSLFLIDIIEMYGDIGINTLEKYYEKHDSLVLGKNYKNK